MKHIVNRFLLLFFVALFSCKKNDPEFPPSLPTVNITQVYSVGDNSVICGGTIVSAGNDEITQKGICYSKSNSPTLEDSVVYYSGNADDFLLSITGLTPQTAYYARAFATNSKGTAYSSNEIVFTTAMALPSVQLVTVSDTSSSSAVIKCKIITDGGGTILSRGVCYSTSPQPTLQNSVTTTNVATDTFSVNIYGIQPSTTYYVRVFATNSKGTAYSSQVSFTTPYQLFAFGQTYQGGVIFYIDNSGVHGLVAAPANQSTSAIWGCTGSTLVGTSDGTLGLGAGAQNTQNIVNGCSEQNIAAKYCADLILGGYSDWHLPSKQELDLMYQNLHTNGFGAFSTMGYWSSTDYNDNQAWSLDFSTGTAATLNKNSPFAVRAIRAF